MKVAIHKENWGFSPVWIKYCKDNNIPYKEVNCYHTDIIKQLEDCDVLLWNHHHTQAKDVLFAKGLLSALEQAGKVVFPDFNSGWHFDDKIGQKYLFEALDIPSPESWVFYEKKEALDWIEKTTFPKVFKLRGGAGSTNVRLVKSKAQAKKLVSKAFGRGFSSYNGWVDLQEQYLRYTHNDLKWIDALKSIRRLFVSTRFAKTVGRQKGYIYFQEFIPDNNSDIRIVTFGSKAIGTKRLTRPNDFRASGSGIVDYSKDGVPVSSIKAAFETSKKMGAFCLAYDFVFDKNDNPKIVEISYGFGWQTFEQFDGYWDEDLNWYPGAHNHFGWIVEEYLRKAKEKKS